MSNAFQDLRHGLRALASRPGLTIAAALSLGLAIGAQTYVSAAPWLEPLPTRSRQTQNADHRG